jgi:hypothetical protein
MPTLPTVSAKFVADVEGMLSDLKRAENATKHASSSINDEVDHIIEHTKRQFTAAKFSHAILEGFGVGTGLGLIETTVEKWKHLFEEADENAKALGEHLKEIRDRGREIAEISFKTFIDQLAPEDQVSKLKGRLGQIENQISGSVAKQQELMKDLALAGSASFGTIAGSAFDPLSGKYGWGTMKGVGDKIDKALTENLKEQDELTKQRLALVGEITEKEKKITEEKNKQIESDHDRRIKAGEAGMKASDKAFDELIEKQHKANEETARAREENEKLADKYRELADPAFKFNQQIAEANRLASDGKISYSQAAIAVAQLGQAIKDATDERATKAIKDTMGDYFEVVSKDQENQAKSIHASSEEIERIVGRSADHMADAWVDALHGVQGAWGNLGDTVIREIERMVAEILIVKPLINGLGGLLGGTAWGGTGGWLSGVASAMSGYGGPKASGGAVDAGYTYRINENGQEFFRPDVGGSIIPVGAASRKSSGSGDTYIIDARGADQSGLARLEAMIRGLNGTIERRAVSAVIAAKRGGGGPAAALA